ncbi:LuxR family two component transcriptional regulator [Saccharopolyspora erythraea NRRL 2338]|uniref:Two component system response regulator n=2 Tax=Saccharopolyspora erythraea TaxID=1836 RepID=A4FAE9_SACEN|nr:response regulator transcription factor [Saccharopolyspora erythraea]EQD83238.1 LuxR family transcriptional regulator [Saccharopolyspora erythraea D]PFG94811.1 LuxR family two component transcriptional regulator [Saccharopolyspora erythraea NRRL 2338]QRK91524.1 response regulator transcription factor [Saccharopolyspora erythraea]CAM01024.1 two component system response regulator [Saccharopolyspora erythraea NRRL 2338]
MTIKVLVVDDQAMVRAGFAALLAAQPDMEVVGEADDGERGVALSHEHGPDVVLMDVRMPVLNGIEATRRLLDPPAHITHVPRVLMLTTFDIDDYVYEALRAGASGFLLKDALPADLIAGVRVVAGGQALLAPTVTRRLIEHFSRTAAPPITNPPRLDVLTDREREVLVHVARGLSNTEIADALFIAEQTVKSHVSRILGKLGVRDRVQAVVVAYETGLVSSGRSS